MLNQITINFDTGLECCHPDIGDCLEWSDIAGHHICKWEKAKAMLPCSCDARVAYDINHGDMLCDACDPIDKLIIQEGLVRSV